VKAYVFNADIYCETCGERIKQKLPVPDYEPPFDTGDYPMGPLENGGGEADVPFHCGYCGLFLENPLTQDGREYVRQALREYWLCERGDPKVLALWAGFYGEELYTR